MARVEFNNCTKHRRQVVSTELPHGMRAPALGKRGTYTRPLWRCLRHLRLVYGRRSGAKGPWHPALPGDVLCESEKLEGLHIIQEQLLQLNKTSSAGLN